MTRKLIGVMAAVMLLVGMLVMPATANHIGDSSGGDHGQCEGLDWIKFDWKGDNVWEEESSKDAPDADISLTITESDEDDDPWEVTWTSDTEVDSAHTKGGQVFAHFSGGTSGTVTGTESPHPQKDEMRQHAISFIVFCFDEPVVDEPEYFVAFTKDWMGDIEGLGLGDDDVTFTIEGVGDWNIGDAPAQVELGQVLTLSEEVTADLGDCTYTSDLPATYTIPSEGENGEIFTISVTNTVTCDKEGEEPTLTLTVNKTWEGSAEDLEGATATLLIDGDEVDFGTAVEVEAGDTVTLSETVEGLDEDLCEWAGNLPETFDVPTDATVDTNYTIDVINVVACGEDGEDTETIIEREVVVEVEREVPGETIIIERRTAPAPTTTAAGPVPTSIPAGSGGYLPNTGIPAFVLFLMGAGALLLGGGVLSAVRSRS